MNTKPLIPNFVMTACCVLSILTVAQICAGHGDPDPTFGHIGLKIDHVSGKEMYPQAIAQQADGKLIVAGNMVGTGYPFDLLLLRRYKSDGYTDTNFGLSGFGVEILMDQAWYIYGHADAVLVQPDGKIVVAGGYYDLSTAYIMPAVFRFMPWGELDTTFGDQGRAKFQGSDSNSVASGIEYFKGKLVTRISQGLSQRLVRLNSDGTLDTTFGESGTASINLIPYAQIISRVGGKIIVGGYDSLYNYPALRYFNSNGSPDTTHGVNGNVSLDVLPECHGFVGNTIFSLDTQADGKVVAGATCASPGTQAYNSIFRLTLDDALDTSFGNGGFALRFSASNDPSRVRVSRSTMQITAHGHPGTQSLKRYGSWGSVQLGYSVTGVVDFLIQATDEKPVTVKGVNNGDIQLKRFIP